MLLTREGGPLCVGAFDPEPRLFAILRQKHVRQKHLRGRQPPHTTRTLPPALPIPPASRSLLRFSFFIWSPRMPRIAIAQLRDGDAVEQIFVLLSKQLGQTSTNKLFIKAECSDATG